MTNDELNRLAKSIATELVHSVEGNEEFLDILFPPRIMDIQEAADFLRIPRATLYSKVSEIPHCRVGRRLVFSDRGLIRYIKREQKEGKA